jgi:glycosyltransferase involved in cell wall biosynthesis
MLLDARATPEYDAGFNEREPLVSVIISTYLNHKLLKERAIPSVLAQSYENWELIVVGDAAPDEARVAVESFGDDRMRFVNLPYRGPYPEDRHEAWLVSGTMPWNTGVSLAKGRWIATNGDDDALLPTHLESLLAHAKANRAEVPYGYMNYLEPDGNVRRVATSPPKLGNWIMQASLIHSSLTFLTMQPSDWLFGVPNDASLLERMLRIGVRFSLLDESVVDYYSSHLWSEIEGRPTDD